MRKKIYLTVTIFLTLFFCFIGITSAANDSQKVRDSLIQGIINLLIKNGQASIAPVNGVCGSSNGTITSLANINLCWTGTPSMTSQSEFSWSWTCVGSGGGTTAHCGAALSIPSNGSCGTSSGKTLTSTPTDNLCSTGTASSILGTGPWSWSCLGINNGTSASCSALLAETVVNGLCGSSNSQSFTSIPTINLCSSGAESIVSGTGPWSWTCAGSGGGTTASCSASLSVTPVNGSCGSSNGVSVSSIPTDNLCSTGTASTVSGIGPWSWGCTGTNGGTTASCSANKITSASISIVSPNGGETFMVGKTIPVSWTLSGWESSWTSSQSVQLQLWNKAGTEFIGTFSTSSPSGSSGGEYQWTVGKVFTVNNEYTEIKSGDYRVRASVVSNTIISNYPVDFSDAYFTITKDYTKFSVVELVEDNLPESITFWTTAHCPDSTMSSRYKTPEGYKSVSCSYGPVGSHGGCSYCAMSKIKLVESSTIENYTENTSINGSCGSSNGVSVSSIPTDNLCSTGTASTVSGIGPWSWTCAGSGGGATVSCLAPKKNVQQTNENNLLAPSKPLSQMTRQELINFLIQLIQFLSSGQTSSVPTVTKVDGLCGLADKTEILIAPASNLCSTGTASTVSGTGPWSWTCAGSGGGATVSCSAPKKNVSVETVEKTNGLCGSSNNVVAISAPTENLCSSGIASLISGTGPWSWTCAGKDGGVDANCVAPKLEEYEKNIVSRWMLDDVSGTTIKDYMGNNYGVTSGDPISKNDSHKIGGRSLYFDGVNDYINIPINNSPLDDFSVSLWVKGSSQSNKRIFGRYAGSVKSWVIGTTSAMPDKFFVGISIDGQTLNLVANSPKAVFDNKWHQISFTWVNGVLSIYVDGELASKSSSTPNQLFNSNSSLTIGQVNNYGFYNGYIEDVRLYNKALDDETIKKAYQDSL